MSSSLPPLHHVGLVVSDMSAAVADFERRWGVWTERVSEMTFEGARYAGEEIDLSARYGFIATGASEIELIEPVSSPSPHADFLRDDGEGIHHLAYVIEDTESHLARLREEPGFSVLLEAPLPGGGRFTYVDGVAHGTAIELIEPAPEMDAHPGPSS